MESHAAGEHADIGVKKYLTIWFGLLALTSIEVYLGYIHFSTAVLLTMLLGLSIVKAAMIMAYFMHLKFERMTLIMTLVPAMVVCIALLGVFFPDSLRLLEMRK